MTVESDAPALVLVAALILFWIGMLGLLLRRSLVGMLVGLLFAWISVSVGAIAFSLLQGNSEKASEGSVLVLCVAFASCLQIAVGLSVIVARIERRGTLDADDAGLLEG